MVWQHLLEDGRGRITLPMPRDAGLIRADPVPRGVGRRLFILGAVCVCAVPLMQCGAGGDPDHQSRRPAPRRVFRSEPFDTGFSVVLAASLHADRAAPLIAAQDSSLYTFDKATREITAWRHDGSVRWRTHPHPPAAAEIVNAIDLEVDPGGGVLVVDAARRTVTRVTRAGELQTQVALAGLLIRDVVALDSHVLVLPVGAGEYMIELDSMLRPSRHFAHPDRRMNTIDPFLRQTFASGAGAAGEWATVYPSGNRLDVFRDTVLHCSGTLVEGSEFPRERRGAQVWAAGVAVTDSVVLVLPRGETEDRLRVLDAYSVVDCSYRYTIRLPRRVSGVAAGGDMIFLAFGKPAPGVIGLRHTRGIRP